MGWTAKMRRDRYPNSFDKNKKYIPGSSSKVYISVKNEKSEDSKNRNKILKEIESRCNNNENLDDIVNEIAQREEVKEQFNYYIKNGITDLASIFKNWYQSQENTKSKHKNNYFER